MATLTRALAGTALLALILGPPTHAAAALESRPAPLHARVVWAREQRVYVALLDSAAIETGTLLEFGYRGKRIAAGEVQSVYGRDMIVAVLSSGSLQGAKKLDRVTITAERPATRAVSMLRVGYPSSTRANLLFACDPGPPRLAPPLGLYRRDPLSPNSVRLVRVAAPADPPPSDSAAFHRAPWPDTLLIRFFDEIADEEIAFERGELDAAVFWPGEASPHARGAAEWRGEHSGTRSAGVVASTVVRPGSADSAASAEAESRFLARMNEEIFRGDLAECTVGTAAAHALDRSGAGREEIPVRFELDPGVPGRRALEEFLNRDARTRTPGEPVRLVRLFYLDAPACAPDSLAAAMAEYLRDGGLSPSLSTACRFRIRCPVLCAPRLKSYLAALGADALVNLVECRASRVKR